MLQDHYTTITRAHLFARLSELEIQITNLNRTIEREREQDNEENVVMLEYYLTVELESEYQWLLARIRDTAVV